MDNDISPEGYSSPLLPFVPAQQRVNKEQERDEVLKQVPLLQTVLKRLEERITETDSNKATRLLATKYKLDAETAMALQEIVHDILDTERSFIQTRIDRTKP